MLSHTTVVDADSSHSHRHWPIPRPPSATVSQHRRLPIPRPSAAIVSRSSPAATRLHPCYSRI